MFALALVAAAIDPIVFFTGRTEGEGTLSVAMQERPVTVRVRGIGRVDPDGTLVLDQRVREGSKPVKERQWRIRQIAPGRYAGTLSDADGPVSGELVGERLHLRFKMKGGLTADQWLALDPGGNSVRNVMTVRKLGVRVATLDETIRRRD
jgi:hypothetical protein